MKKSESASNLAQVTNVAEDGRLRQPLPYQDRRLSAGHSRRRRCGRTCKGSGIGATSTAGFREGWSRQYSHLYHRAQQNWWRTAKRRRTRTVGTEDNEPMQFDLIITIIDDEPLSIPLKAGSRVFVVGPNGSGKSALIQHAVTSLGSQKRQAHLRPSADMAGVRGYRLDTARPTGIWSTA